jgi:photosystem II stability/assembly factor-like uncharacterized protein
MTRSRIASHGGPEVQTCHARHLAVISLAAVVAAPLAGSPGRPTYVNCLAIDPSSPSTVYSGRKAGGILKSTDAGKTWTPAGKWDDFTSVRSLAIDPAHPRTVYAGTFSGKVHKSTDGGAHWARLPLDVYTTPIQAIAIDPKNSRTIYVGTEGGSDRAGVQKSTDGGATWKRLVNGFPSAVRIYGLAVDPVNPLRILAAGFGDGMFFSTDGAGHWKEAAGPLEGKLVCAVAVAKGSAIATVQNGGMFRSTDGGERWDSMDDDKAASLAFDPSNPKNAWAGGWNKILRSTDGGESWQKASDAHRVHFPSIAVDPRSSSTVYAGSSQSGVWKTTDAGESWKKESGSADEKGDDAE